METLCPTSAVSQSSWLIQQGQSSGWTKEENKRFESALAIFDEKTPHRWDKVAEMIPGKSVYDVMNQYTELVADVSDIEAGLVPIPGYLASSFTFELPDAVYRKRPRITTTTSCDQERKKGVPWTEEEHRRFLLGLEKHGKGDWRNISRNFVVTKTPTQVASHAQKYYLRQVSGGKDKRRPSIHDITAAGDDDDGRGGGGDRRRLISTTTTAATTCSSSVKNNNNNHRIVVDWNCHVRNDAAALIVLDSSSTCGGESLIEIAKNINGGHCIFNIGASASAAASFYINSPRFYG